MYKVIQTGLATLQVTINNKSSVVYVCVLSFFLFLFARDYNIWEEKIHHQAIMFTLHQDEQQFLFESQTKFSASLDWPFSQQQTLVQQPKANTDIWLKQPPDFSEQLYRSSNPSQKPQGKGKRELKPKPTSESIVMQQLSRLRSSLLLPLSEKGLASVCHSLSMDQLLWGQNTVCEEWQIWPVCMKSPNCMIIGR